MPTKKERIGTILRVFAIVGLSEQWLSVESIDASKDWIVAHKTELRQSIPAYVMGDLSRLTTSDYRRTLLAFLRRLALYSEAELVRRRTKQRRRHGKKQSLYSFRLQRNATR